MDPEAQLETRMQSQLDRIEKLLSDLAKDSASHRSEIAWLKTIMTGFFATVMAVIYKVFGK